MTVGIGGNDADLIGVAEECVKLDVLWPFGDRRKAHYQSGGTDTGVQRIDSVAQAAAANAATYVNTFTSSIDHDACAGSNAWVNGLAPTSAAYPLHPNAGGEANMARQVEATLS